MKQTSITSWLNSTVASAGIFICYALPAVPGLCQAPTPAQAKAAQAKAQAQALKKTFPLNLKNHVPIVKHVNYRNIEVIGEVVDTWCFASKAVLDGRGPEHYRCADACAHGGVTLGIVDDAGTLYIAAKTRAYQGCQHMLEPFVARRVHVKGWLSQAGGCNIMKIGSVELATDKPQPKLPIDK